MCIRDRRERRQDDEDRRGAVVLDRERHGRRALHGAQAEHVEAGAPVGRALLPIADSGDTGLLTGVEQLPGFSLLEESEPSERVQVALAAVDQKALDAAEAAGEELPTAFPALALTDVGEGRVIRVGLSQWGAELRRGSIPVQQLTRNIADILRGARPEIRTFEP